MQSPFFHRNTLTMNIFVLDLDPRAAARAHADKHVVKMILEAVQMLYTAHWVLAYPHLLEHKSPVAVSHAQKELSAPSSLLAQNTPQPPYRPVHLHHPCTRWVRESIKNYQWLCLLAIAIGEEHQHRWPSSLPHSCLKRAKWLLLHPPARIAHIPLTPFALAMPNEYKVQDDPVTSYRAFYCGSKTDRGITSSYTNRPAPSWLIQSPSKEF